MDQEQLREFEEQLRTLSSVIAQASQIQSSAVSQMQRSLGISRQETQAKQEGTKATEDLTQSTGALTAAQKATIQANREHQDAMRNAVRAAEQFGGAMGTLSKTVLDTNRTFGKYGSTLSQVGDAAQTLGKNFGLVGQIAGGLVKALTFVAEKSLEQADNLVTATDSLRKIGAVGGQTSEEFLGMAHASGVVSQNLEMLVKPLQALGPALIGLGNTAGDGVKAFGAITAVSRETRMEFRRLGISQEELIESQAAYLQLQDATGRSMRRTGETEEKRAERLQTASLEYTKNLVELAALTGKDVKSLQQLQEQAQAEFTFMVHINQLKQEEEELRRQGLDDQADAIKKRREAEEHLVNSLAAVGADEQTLQGLRESIASGGAIFSDATSGLALLMGQSGRSMNEFTDQLGQGENVTAEFLTAFKDSTQAGLDRLGRAFVFGGEELGQTFGITRQNMQAVARRVGIDEEQAAREARERRERGSRTGFDRTMDARAQLTELEISAGVAMDKLLAKVNPLIGGASALTIALGVATAALGVFSTGLMFNRMAGSRMGGRGGLRLAGRARLARRTAASTSARSLARGGGVAGAGVVAGGVAAYRAVGEGRDRREDIERRRESGLISEEEARAAQRASSARTAGQASGGMAGALAGAKGGALAGAKLGMFAGPKGAAIGAALGGLIGAGLGAWAGSSLGSQFGGAVGELIGESISIESVEEDLVNLNAELELMRLRGASDEEIANKEAELQLTEMLGKALEEGNGYRVAQLKTELELLEAQKDTSEEGQRFVSQLERQAEIQSTMVNQAEELADAEALLARHREAGVKPEILAGYEAEANSRREALEHTQNLALASQRLLDIDKKIREGGHSEEQLEALNRERTSRNELLEQYSELERAQRNLAIAAAQDDNKEGVKNAQARIDAAKKEIETRERALRISDLEAEREEAGWRRRRQINREMRELENLSQPSIGSDGAEAAAADSTEGAPVLARTEARTRTEGRAEISGFSRAEFHAANPEAFAEFEEYRRETQEQLMQGYLDNLSDETKERMEENPQYRNARMRAAQQRAENHALILAAEKFQTEIEEATDAVINISEGYTDSIRANLEGVEEAAEDLIEEVDLEEQQDRALDLAKTVANGLISVTPFGIFNRIRDRFDNKADEQEQEVIETLEDSEISYDDIEESNELRRRDLSELKSSSLELAKSIADGLNALSPRSIFNSMVDRFKRKRDQEEDEVEGIVDGIDEVNVDEAPAPDMNSVLSGIQEKRRQRATDRLIDSGMSMAFLFGTDEGEAMINRELSGLEVAEVPFPESQPFNISPDIASPANQLNEVQRQMADELNADQADTYAKFLEEMVELQKTQVEMFGRLETLNQEMVDKLDEGNEVSDQILKHSY